MGTLGVRVALISRGMDDACRARSSRAMSLRRMSNRHGFKWNLRRESRLFLDQRRPGALESRRRQPRRLPGQAKLGAWFHTAGSPILTTIRMASRWRMKAPAAIPHPPMELRLLWHRGSNGLSRTGRVVEVSGLTKDGKTVTGFKNGKRVVQQVLESGPGLVWPHRLRAAEPQFRRLLFRYRRGLHRPHSHAG